MSRSVMIATPSHDGKVHVPYLRSFLASQEPLRSAGIAAHVEIVSGISFIVAARNLLLHRFLQSRHDDMLFIDTDMGWPSEAIPRLLAHDLPIVAAAGVVKNGSGRFAIRLSKQGGRINRDAKLLGVDAVGAAFMRIRRDCAEAMAKQFSALVYQDPAGFPVVGLFNPILEARQLMTEDISFCHRWRSMGGMVWVDAGIKLDHWGSKSYSADPAVLMKIGTIKEPQAAR